MWGTDNWGEMIWAGDGALLPLLEPTAIIALVAAILIGTVVVARRAHAPR
jgi:hypothetical protein